MSEAAKWYVVHTYSGYENKVAENIKKAVENRNLHDLISEVLVPTETVKEIKDNKTRKVERKIFPGYVLVQMIMTDDSWYVVRNICGVTGFVGLGSEPVPLSDAEVEALGVGKNKGGSDDADSQGKVEVSYAVGDSVRITSGPLEGFVGVVDDIDKIRDVVTVTIFMLGRETPTEFSLGQVSPLK